ncbi:CASP8 and FADD-like apoptosis regulator [Pseudophryne corroboree]|uniref:CASP8 and FADD-like apoptosis regulator n=1 Tax=Pseudophryne corroboree TaxID=495146 RepID=UPI00308214BD
MPSIEPFCRYTPRFFLTVDAVTPRDTVMTSNCLPSSAILQIEEELDSEEREVISFAYREIALNTNTRDLLSELNETTEHGLAEVLYLVKRFDLLKRYLKKSRTDVEKLMSTQSRRIPEYRSLFIDLNDQLEEEDLESLVFLLKNELKNAGKLKKKTFLSLVTELEKNRSITPENLDLLEKSLELIHRVDLKNRVLKFKQKVHRGPYINAFAESATIPWTINQNSSCMGPRFETNGHIGAAPVQETGCVVQGEISNERYLVRQESMGFCLIIDCVGNDAEMLEHTFLALNFIVNLHKHKKVAEVETILREAAAMEQHRHHDVFVCIVISCGNADSLFCVDGGSQGLSLDRIKNLFTGQSCPNLIGKPKLFFIQNYFASDVEEGRNLVEVDGLSQGTPRPERTQRGVRIPNEADIFWSHCKVDEMELRRSSGSPSLYLRSLVDLLSNKQKRKHQDIQDIHTELNRIIYSKRRGYSLQLRHTLTKKLFLHPAAN